MPSQDILINWSPQETRVAVVENGAVQELHIERTLERGMVGNVYLGKVVRVLPGMQSAFVDIGLDRAAFLHVADLHPGGHVPKADKGVDVPLVPIVLGFVLGRMLEDNLRRAMSLSDGDVMALLTAWVLAVVTYQVFRHIL